MTFKCLECGHIFESGEEAIWREERGEAFGSLVYEELTGCPICKGAYEETQQCSFCGSHHLKEELKNGLCCECFEELRKEVKV